jgi:hypothetical protein
MKKLLLKVLAIILVITSISFAQQQLPIGMNIDSNNYYTQNLIYNDVMKTASPWISFNVGNNQPWDSGLIKHIPLDSAGYPLEIPYTPQNETAQKVRFLINNNYPGNYILLFDGDGVISIHNSEHSKLGPNKYSITLTGYAKNLWIDIDSSTVGNHIRNMRIIPEEYDGREEEMPLFYRKFLEGLEPFKALRFMDWMHTNNSEQKAWQDRSQVYYYSYGLPKGMPIEHAIELCNTLQADAWFCVPHQADDDYIMRFAEMVRDNLDTGLKVYVEYSNEIWNWQFTQAHYVGQNAPGHNNQYVIDALTAIHPTEYIHPEKDAYMIQRALGLWSDVFSGADRQRLVTVGTGQQGWMDNSRRILEYLFKQDMHGNAHTDNIYAASTGAGCDAFSVAGYFNFEERHHLEWNAMDPANVTPEMIIDTVAAIFDETSGTWTDVTAQFTNAFAVDYLVYEGGQHMQPYLQGEYDYNQSVWDAQIHPKMYDLYMKNFRKHVGADVNCKLFMAFSYVGDRESRWGSWGHLESLSQVGASDYMDIAPKYQALLDANSGIISDIEPKEQLISDFELTQNYPNPFNPSTMISYSVGAVGTKGHASLHVDLTIYNTLGQKMATLVDKQQPAGSYKVSFDAQNLSSGIYYYRLVIAGKNGDAAFSSTKRMLLLK